MVCEKENIEFVKMMSNFEIMLDYTVFLIEKGKNENIFQIYNYVFEQYFPESTQTLNSINYDELFTGKYAEATIEIYKELLDLWMILQEKTVFNSEELSRLKLVHKKILEIV